jgi:hypothetical protein
MIASGNSRCDKMGTIIATVGNRRNRGIGMMEHIRIVEKLNVIVILNPSAIIPDATGAIT